MIYFAISSGELFQDGNFLSKAYAGRGQGLNNPDAQALEGIGPIPCGLYTIGEPHDSPQTGPFTLNLEPDRRNQMYGRSLFRWHGDNQNANFSASEGCIVSPIAVRRAAWISGERQLMVVRGPSDINAAPTSPINITRGVRNNNPGNIRRSAEQWEGLNVAQHDPDFFQFVDPEHGIRAICKILSTYRNSYSLDTVAKLIGRWAPTNENDTAAYADFVAKRCGVPVDETINPLAPQTMYHLVEAIIAYENSNWVYAPNVVASGLTMAGIPCDVPPDQRLMPLAPPQTEGGMLAWLGSLTSSVSTRLLAGV